MKNNICKVVDAGLCMGCGLCVDTCGKKIIRFHHGKDLNYPIVDANYCTECGTCLKVCAGQGIDLDARSMTLFKSKSIEKDKYIGFYDQCFSGYSLDSEIRYHSASGGCVSQFLIYLLDKKYIDGAVVVGYESNNVMKPCSYIAHSKEEILSSRSSKYCVTSFEGIISKIKQEGGRYVVVGLPCQIQAFRKVSSVFKFVNKCLVGYFAIYCSSNRTMRSQEFLLYRYKVKKNKVSFFSYRDNGCLGEMIFKDKTGEALQSVPYPEYWLGMKGFFNVPRCSLCIDHFGELADVCFGDIHVGAYINDHVGVNSIVSRSNDWTKILQEAMKEGYLHLDEISCDIIKSSQVYAMKQKKGKGVVAAFRLRQIFGKKNPIYDQPFVVSNVNIKDIFVALLKCCMRWAGRQKYLWPILCKI